MSKANGLSDDAERLLETLYSARDAVLAGDWCVAGLFIERARTAIERLHDLTRTVKEDKTAL